MNLAKVEACLCSALTVRKGCAHSRPERVLLLRGRRTRTIVNEGNGAFSLALLQLLSCMTHVIAGCAEPVACVQHPRHILLTFLLVFHNVTRKLRPVTADGLPVTLCHSGPGDDSMVLVHTPTMWLHVQFLDLSWAVCNVAAHVHSDMASALALLPTATVLPKPACRLPTVTFNNGPHAYMHVHW